MSGFYHSERSDYMQSSKDSCGDGKSSCGSHGAGVVLWFIFIAFIIFFIIVAVKPDFVKDCDHHGNIVDSVNIAYAIGWSILIALIICVIFWALWAFAYDRKSGY